ncbi:DUF3574 domain-containing protein [Streptomyces sp. NPDC093589]|uniref:DUF3574 domain-containing protein n=1 Tax=Streptomyces sp. NPDC093589 TaxID=3366043 RepID=UPI003825BE7E
MPPPRLRLAVLAVSTALLGVAAPAAPAAPAGAPATQPPHPVHGSPYIETSLYFGTARPDGGPAVTDRQFRAFVDEIVTPAFPAGLSVKETYGQYRDAHGTIERERSYELTLLYPTSRARPSDSEIEHIRAVYNRRFAQESVARVDDRARVDF